MLNENITNEGFCRELNFLYKVNFHLFFFALYHVENFMKLERGCDMSFAFHFLTFNIFQLSTSACVQCWKENVEGEKVNNNYSIALLFV